MRTFVIKISKGHLVDALAPLLYNMNYLNDEEEIETIFVVRDKDTYSLRIRTKGEDYPPPNPIQEENAKRADETLKKDKKRWRKGAIAIKL
jgi:hypothetical protein